MKLRLLGLAFKEKPVRLGELQNDHRWLGCCLEACKKQRSRFY
jgi:hypothetical protein